MSMIIFRIILAILVTVSTAQAGNHWFTGLPLTAAGWADYDTMTNAGYESARVVFVSSSSGNDTTAANNITANGHYGIADVTFDANGIFQAPVGVVPFATIATAYTYCRSGYPDIILLEAGSDFNQGLNAFGAYTKSGVSQTVRSIISMYGTGARPKLYDATTSVAGTQFAIISELHFYTNDWLNATARVARVESGASHILFEGVVADQVLGGFNLQTASYVAVRRSRMSNSYAHDGTFGGSKTQNVLLEDSIFYKPNEPAGGYGRMIYTAAESEPHMNGVVVRGCTFYLAGLNREGIHMRAGGAMDNNIVVQAPIYYGSLGGSDARAQTAHFVNNVMVEAAADGATSYAKFANIDTGNISNNIWADTSASGPGAFAMLITGDNSYLNVAKNISITNNIVTNWEAGTESGGLKFSLTDDVFENITISSNDLQMSPTTYRLIQNLNPEISEITASNNRYYSTKTSRLFDPGPYFTDWVSAIGETGATFSQVSYSDASRTVKTYNQTIGGTTSTEEYMTNAIASYLTRAAWSDNYQAPTVNNYIRGGFDKTAISYSYESISYPGDPSCAESLSFCTTSEDCSSQDGSWAYTGHTTVDGDVYYCYPSGSAPDPTCSDLTQNGDETGVDCGGGCPACADPPTTRKMWGSKPIMSVTTAD